MFLIVFCLWREIEIERTKKEFPVISLFYFRNLRKRRRMKKYGN